MKALIVDDERHVRSSVRKLIDWGQEGVSTILEAESGSEAKAIILNQQPQVVITDIMMPDLTGIQLMEWLETNHPTCKKIVISGYNDFELVRNVVKYGGTDYILKPIVPAQLLEAIRKAVREWSDDERERQDFMRKSIEVNGLKPLYQDRLLSKFIEHPEHKEDLFREFPQLADVQICRVGVTQLEWVGSRFMNKFSKDIDLLSFAMTNIFNEILVRNDRGIAFRNWNRHAEIVMLFWGELAQAEQLLTEVTRMIKLMYNVNLAVGLGDAAAFPDKVRDSYLQGCKALHSRNLLAPSSLIHVFQADFPRRSPSLRFTDYADKIWMSIKTKNPENIREAVQEWMKPLSELDTISLEQFNLWRDGLNVTITDWLTEAEHSADPLPDFPLPCDELGNFSLAIFQEALFERFIRLSATVTPNAGKNNTMQEIALYIQNHYNRDITLQEISRIFFLNRDYISRRFKQEFDETIVNYMSKIRIDKAKRLLKQADMPIGAIAQTVGYEDEKYFSRVFKKYEGMTPKEFRNQ
ncbi:response regulator [Paenibacillus sp. GCM10027628]|uniref:response regulator transcription factor n=1 Tax=Paenibacillus sp. GCM10027628 TaxID=3273413 RepID=UPI00363F53B3